MRFFIVGLIAIASMAAASSADAAKHGAKSTKFNAVACASIRSDMRHKGGAYIPAGVKCGKRKV
jgi:hypothetical protein